jgi:transcriptional regulator with XRE-family HTH domain
MFGKRLKELREKAELNQTELGKYFGLDRATISRYENSNREPNPEMIIKFANFFNVSSDYLLGLTDDPTDPNVAAANYIEQSVSDDPELLEFWQMLRQREDLQLLFKQVKPLPPEAIKDVINIVRIIEKREAEED